MCTGVDPDDTIHEIFQEAINTVTRDLLLKSKRNSNEGSCSDREEDLTNWGQVFILAGAMWLFVGKLKVEQPSPFLFSQATMAG